MKESNEIVNGRQGDEEVKEAGGMRDDTTVDQMKSEFRTKQEWNKRERK